MIVNLRVDSANNEHIHCTLFMNGASCGTLCFRVGEYQLFTTALLMGAQQTRGQLLDQSDKHIFTEWARKGDKK